jgi:hypothetical protein
MLNVKKIIQDSLEIVYLYVVKGTVQRKLTGVLSGINRKLMISSIVAGYFLKFFTCFVTLY